jgi:hypothetical protein
MVHVQFVSQLFNFPLKEPQTKLEPLTEKDLYDILGALFGYVFLDSDEVVGFKLKESVIPAYKALAELVKFNVTLVSRGGKLKSWADDVEKRGFLDSYGNNLIRRLVKAGKSIDEIVKDIMPTAAASTANQGQQVFPHEGVNFVVYSNA